MAIRECEREREREREEYHNLDDLRLFDRATSFASTAAAAAAACLSLRPARSLLRAALCRAVTCLTCRRYTANPQITIFCHDADAAKEKEKE